MFKKLCERRNGKKDNKGFTLVELIVVIAIMAILAVAMTPKLTQYLDKAKVATDEEIINTINTAVKIALIDEDAYATVGATGHDYVTGLNILKDYDSTFTTATNLQYMRESDTSNTYTYVTSTTLTEFEKQILEAIGTSFTFKSNAATQDDANEITITVTNQGTFEVNCTVNGTNAFYKIENN